MSPKSKNSHKRDPVQVTSKIEKEIINENIDPIRARQLSHVKIKSYSLENKIKILLFNSKLLIVAHNYPAFNINMKS